MTCVKDQLAEKDEFEAEQQTVARQPHSSSKQEQLARERRGTEKEREREKRVRKRE